jgi:hypothetical protein
MVFFSAQKNSVSSPLSFAGRIAKPLRGGGGGTVPRATSETAAPPVVPANPLARVQNEERYATVFICFAYLILFLCSGGKVPYMPYLPRPRLCLFTHSIHRQARIVVLPVSMNWCIIRSLSVLVLYPTLVVRSIGRHTLYLQTRTHSSPIHVHSMELKVGRRCPDVPRA